MGETCTNAAVWSMLAERWRKTIRAKALSTNTERGYLYTARRWAEWLSDQGHDVEPADVEAHHVDDFIVDIIEATSAANGAHHYRNLRVYFAWLVKRKEIKTGNPMDETEPPNVPEKITPLLSDEEHAAVLLTCSGKSLADLRDTAIVLLFIDTGMRVSELHSIDARDVDLTTKRLKICGKGNKERWVRFGASTGLALARYLKARAKHPLAESCSGLWLSRRVDKPLCVDGIKHMLNRRGRQAKVSDSLHAHRFRHDFTHRWKQAGGSEHGLMIIAGWSSTKMPRHYGKQAEVQRALDEHERLSPADSLIA
ncbi:tyrosine-type recombinase/integrase [Actinocrispum wychmicini]|uniref:Site-specific recombinase XerD n=1 Tax=Actinocrispum wychmicini TaxID=1213861 RepID=A0A4R2KD21_9PSEU|nr:tyrosine-type recombinase/integrase [Actinocrispum wychmicini]TCO64405.1 site-specific recombinase XerD [Actinocrispum wychmicini]